MGPGLTDNTEKNSEKRVARLLIIQANIIKRGPGAADNYSPLSDKKVESLN
jgi:hypothetical protein